MSLNFDNIGRNLCKIEGGKYNNKIVSVDTKDNDKVKKTFDKLKLEGKMIFMFLVL